MQWKQQVKIDGKQRRVIKTEVESFKNETKNSIILADQMANSVQLQQEVQHLCDCRACVFILDVQNTGWTDTGGISRIQLIRTPLVYKIDGRLENTGQITISVTLGQNTEYENIENDPDQYRLTISPQEVYVFRLVASSDKNFSIVLQNVLRTLRASKSRIEELLPSPRDAWVKEAALSSPSQPKTEQFLKSSYLGTRVPSTRHLEPVNSSLGSAVTSHVPNLNEQRSLQNQQTMGTPCSPTSSMRRSDFDIYIETLCITLADAISKGDVQTASEIIKIMAQQQIPLSIKMKNPKVVSVEHGDKTIDLKVVVEDRETSGGSFVMKVLTTTTIEKLQEEVAERFGFHPKVQKWIIGKMMAKPSQTLADCHVHKAGHTAFLYLVSGKTAGLKRQEFERYRRGKEGERDSSGSELQIPNGTSGNISSTSSLPATTSPLSRATSMPALQNAGLPRAEGIVISEPSSRTLNRNPPPPSPDMRVNQGGITRRDDRILTASSISSIQRELQRQEMGMLIDEDVNQGHSIPVEDTEVPQGWRCSQCTYINTPTRPGCEICAADRPQDYIVPENTMVREQERIRMEEERRQQELFEQALQEQEEQQAMAREINFLQLVQTAQQSLIENTEEFDCAICFTNVLPGEGVMLRECLHCFCRDCLREHIRNCTDPEVQCPFQDDEFACHSLITAQEIKSLLSIEDFDKFLNRSLATAESQAANSFHCKTPNCPGWCIYEDNSNIFHCPVCDKQNCLTCKAQHFPEMNCKEYQEDLKRRAKNDQAAKQTQEFLEKMITKGDAMKCPQCEIILLKKDGCDWMRCSMCRLEICWATRGPRWGPQGVGDLSGGCKCRVQGKKCHPKCRNCH